MRSFIAIATLALTMLLWAPGRLHAEEPAGPIESIVVLKLSDEQVAKITDIHKKYKANVQDARKELVAVVKEEMDKVRDVLTAEQKQKLQTFKEDRKEQRHDRLAERCAHLEELDLTDAEKTKIGDIRREFRPQTAKALAGLKGFLNDDQRKERDADLHAGKKRSEVIAALNLTAEQKEKLETIGKELAGLLKEEMEKIQAVLTEGQEEKLQEIKDERPDRVRDRVCHRIANAQDLNLTNEQKNQIADIRKEYRPKVQEAGNKLRAAVREEMEAVIAVLK
jgi:Spy/CpxP family protein refolding chaperone